MKWESNIRRWEIALLLSLTLTLSQSVVPHWWGVVFPGLTPEQSAPAVAAAHVGETAISGVELRFQLLDGLRDLFS